MREQTKNKMQRYFTPFWHRSQNFIISKWLPFSRHFENNFLILSCDVSDNIRRYRNNKLLRCLDGTCSIFCVRLQVCCSGDLTVMILIDMVSLCINIKTFMIVVSYVNRLASYYALAIKCNVLKSYVNKKIHKWTTKVETKKQL